jgi:aconitate hydratase
MPNTAPDRWTSLDLEGRDGAALHVDLPGAACALGGSLKKLPYVLRIILENLVRNQAVLDLGDDVLARVASWSGADAAFSVPMMVSRVILPDSSGLPALIDLAALRSTLTAQGVDASGIGPQIPVDLVVDHSLIVDQAGHAGAAAFNVAREFERNGERYRFLKWAQQAFDGLRIVPPGVGIVHQVHVERLASVVAEREGQLFPEFVLGGDSHTPMVGALGVLAWGVGGIEAEAAILGQPYMVRVGEVVGVRLNGELREGVTTTDLVLALTQRLRQAGVVGQYVEFTGEGAARLTVPDRATLSNMAPEYGATCGFFPIDAATIAYLHESGREADHVATVEAYARATGLYREVGDAEPTYSRIVELDVSAVEPSLAGPRRPQDRVALGAAAGSFRDALDKAPTEGGFGVDPAQRATLALDGEGAEVGHGVLAIAAIASCTNTSNPGVMLGAGLMAKRAGELGLKPKPWVKTSLAPGSRVVTRYLEEAGLLGPLEQFGFHVIGYGCTTCSGKSGPIDPAVAEIVEREGIVAASILSGNRNFEGRIHRLIRANYLASPMLVFAYALAGRIDVDLTREPLSHTPDGKAVYLADLWPDRAAIEAVMGVARSPELYRANYADLFGGTPQWDKLEAPRGKHFPFDESSTYIIESPFFTRRNPVGDAIEGARVLGVFGDSLTTDHITPAGEIGLESEAGRYLSARGVPQQSFNAFTQRRGNHEVMLRGAFANPRIRNLLVPGSEGGVTLSLPSGEQTSIYAAAAAYRDAGTPMIVLAGKDYGMGSSRDWAAKGTALLGIRAVIAENFERIHRSNLVALGVVPLRFREGESWRSLGLTGRERFDLAGIGDAIARSGWVTATATDDDGKTIRFEVQPVIEAATEIACLNAGGMFATIHDKLLAECGGASTTSKPKGA